MRPQQTQRLSPLLVALLRAFVLAAEVHRDVPPPNPLAHELPPDTTTGSSKDTRPTPAPLAPISPFWSSEEPGMAIVDYAHRIVLYSGYGETGMLMGLVLLARYMTMQAADDAPLSPLTIHRLLLASVLVAYKANEDLFYQNAYIAQVGGVPLEDVNDLESAFCVALHYAVQVTAEDIRALCTRATVAAATNDPHACEGALKSVADPPGPWGWPLPSLIPPTHRKDAPSCSNRHQ